MKSVRKAAAFLVCLPGVLLPYRARVLYSEALGWAVQFVYMNYIYVLKYLLASLAEPPGGERKA